MNTLRDVLARDRRSDAPALRAPGAGGGRAYDYRRFCTTAWKVGNFLRHLGVRHGVGVGVAADPVPEPVLAFAGASLLGAVVRFDPPRDADVRALVVPAARLDAHETEPGTRRVAYGGDPNDPTVAYFERDVWSENPTMPPDGVGPDDDLLASSARCERCDPRARERLDERAESASETRPEGASRKGERAKPASGATREHGSACAYTHADVLDAARRVAEEWDLGAGDAVAVRTPLTEPGTVAAGVVAPLLAGAAILLPDGEAVGDYAVGGTGAPESDPVAPDAVLR